MNRKFFIVKYIVCNVNLKINVFLINNPSKLKILLADNISVVKICYNYQRMRNTYYIT